MHKGISIKYSFTTFTNSKALNLYWECWGKQCQEDFSEMCVNVPGKLPHMHNLLFKLSWQLYIEYQPFVFVRHWLLLQKPEEFREMCIKKTNKKTINGGFCFTHTYIHKNPSFFGFFLATVENCLSKLL